MPNHDIVTSIHGARLGLDNYGNLVLDGKIVGAQIQTLGTVYYVDSVTGDDNLLGTTPNSALATLAEAMDRVTADKGDVIVLLPKHAETITGAGGITIDVAGVTVLGLGRGNQRPRFLMDGGTTVTALVTAAGVTLSNIIFASGHSNVVAGIDVSAVDVSLLNLSFQNNTTNEDFLTPIKVTSTTDNAADGLRVEGCRWTTSDVDDLEFIEVNGSLDRGVFVDNFICTKGTASPFILTAGAKNLTNVLIRTNIIQSAMTANDLFIDNGGATNTGIVAYNLVGNLDVTGAQVFGVATGLQFFENYMTSTSTESGGLQLTADTPNS